MKTLWVCDKKAFTLIELLIAVSIFAVVAVALYSTFYAGVSIWRRSSEGGDIHQQIKYALDDVTRELRNAVYITSDEESIYVFSARYDEISFVSSEGSYTEGDAMPLRELVKIKYEFDDKEGQLIRMRAGKPLGFDIEKAEKEVVLGGIEGFKLNYCHSSGEKFEPYLWEEEWEDGESRIPRGVRLIMTVRAGESREPIELTKTIFIPTGILGEKKVGL